MSRADMNAPKWRTQFCTTRATVHDGGCYVPLTTDDTSRPRRARIDGESRSFRARRLKTQHFCHIMDHYLVGAAADRDEAGVDEGAAGSALAHVAEAAVELDALVGDVARHAAAEELRHRDLHRRVLVFDALANAMMRELARGGDLGQHLDELELRHLHLAERLLEDDAVLAPAPRLFPERPRARGGADARDQPLVLELHHLLLEAAADVADRVRHRHAHVLEEEKAGVGPEVPDLVEQLVAEAGRVRRHDDLREAAVAGVGVRDGEE